MSICVLHYYKMKRLSPIVSVVFVVIVSLMPGGGARGADPFEGKRLRMVEDDIRGRGVKDPRVLGAMRKVERHLFVDASLRDSAYSDRPLPIGEGQTISQPYVVALMTEAVGLKGGEKVLEVGTGSGYQAAVLAVIAGEVYTVEIKRGLHEKAAERLTTLGYANVHATHGDGYFGWEEKGPFDVVMVTASANHIPPPLLAQLKEGGRLIIPLGSTLWFQNLTLVTKERGKYRTKELGGVRFVPMTGQAQKR